MNLLQHIPRWVKNKYTIVTLVFLLFMLFLDSRNVFNQYHRYREMKNLEKSHHDLTLMNRKLDRDNRELQSNHAEIEKVAREKYHMKRKNETLFLFSDGKSTENDRLKQ